MNERERFLALFNYRPVDRTPIWDFGFWDQTLTEWRKQGMPADAKPDDFFGMDRQWQWGPINVGLCPSFEPRELEDRGEFKVVLMADGVIARQPKDFTSMPEFIDYTLKDRATWEEHYKWRLDPDAEGRIPPAFHSRLKELKTRDYPALIHCGSILGSIRNWFGLENFSYIQFDDPKLFAEIVETSATCIAVTLERALTAASEAGVTFDMGHFWEDICYNHGPLVNPKTFRELAVPQIRRITDIGRKHGIELFSVDCDGKIDDLILPWRDGGLQTMFPLEIGDWADPVELRQRFGKELLMMGGIDKRTLARSRKDIDAMIEHLTPLVEEGAYLPTPDHRVPPTVSLENYVYYLDRIKEVWGRGLPDVRPTGRPQKK
jgi:uroporphyrinogen decarboxylase